jgi:hypothetical protein
MMTCEDCGEEYDSDGECDCEDDDEEEDDDLDEATLTDLENKRKEHIVTGMKKSEADLKSRYGDKWKSVMYAKATKNALYDEVKKAKPGHNAAVMSKNIDKVLSAVKKEEVESSKYDTPAKKKPVSMMSKDEKDKNDERRNAYKDYQKSVRKESVDLDEAFKAGSMKLNDGSSVTLTNESSNALNTLFNQLTSSNKTKMEQRLMSGSKGFNEILAFAKEV